MNFWIFFWWFYIYITKTSPNIIIASLKQCHRKIATARLSTFSSFSIMTSFFSFYKKPWMKCYSTINYFSLKKTRAIKAIILIFMYVFVKIALELCYWIILKRYICVLCNVSNQFYIASAIITVASAFHTYNFQYTDKKKFVNSQHPWE